MAASTPAANKITIYNADRSPKTLTIGLAIVAVGMPCVLSYTAIVYWTFRGKVELGAHGH